MLDPLEFKGVSYVLIQLLAFTALILSVISLRKELISEKPAHGFFSFILVIGVFCLLISLFSTYVQVQRPVSTLLKWERAAFTSKG